VLDDERVLGDREMRPLPAGDPDHGDEGGKCEQDRPHSANGRPGSEKTRSTRQREGQRTQERPRQGDSVPVRFHHGVDHVGFVLFPSGNPWEMGGTARRAATATLVAIAIVVAALALWKIRVVLALLFLGFVIASAMRPSVEWLYRRARVPRSVGVVIHYLGFLAALTLFLYLIVPVAITQIDHAIGQVPTSRSQLHHAAVHSHGIRHEILSAIDKRLRQLPSGASLLHPAVTVTKTVLEVVVGILFMFAVAAYWIFERDATIALVQSLLPRKHRRVTRDTWVLIDMKLGAFVRGQLLLVTIVATLLSLAFWLDGEPYWLLIGTSAGVVELVPIVGPLAAGAAAVGAGLTVSWSVALGAGIAVLILRQLQDYVIAPRVMGHAVGLSPLVVLVSVVAIGYLLGPIYVLIATPIASVIATLVDVVVRGRDPAEEEPPAVLFAGAGEGKR
jgi:predicted PurR-regulated permease PerM